jgi:hypothetical protein
MDEPRHGGLMDKYIIYPIILIIIVFISMFIVGYNQRMQENEYCYQLHVSECEDAHKQNLTYYLCSGLILPPQPNDNEYYCRISPTKNCSEVIPRECLI